MAHIQQGKPHHFQGIGDTGIVRYLAHRPLAMGTILCNQNTDPTVFYFSVPPYPNYYLLNHPILNHPNNGGRETGLPQQRRGGGVRIASITQTITVVGPLWPR